MITYSDSVENICDILDRSLAGIVLQRCLYADEQGTYRSSSHFFASLKYKNWINYFRIKRIKINNYQVKKFALKN